MIRWIIFGGLLFFLYSCSKEEENPPEFIPYSHFNRPLVNTGYYAYDINGSLIRVIGIPNTFRSVSSVQGVIRMTSFPNPARLIQTESGQKANWNVQLQGPFPNGDRRAFLVRASETANFDPGIFTNGAYFQALDEPTVVWQGQYGILFNISIPADEPGDYRLYLEMDGYYLYDNLAIRSSGTF
jgi:hypothetical protein